MQHLIHLHPEPSGQYTAYAVGIPELQAAGATPIEAVERVRAMLAEWVQRGRLLRVEVPEENPILRCVGDGKIDPDFQEYLAEIRRYRQEEDERSRPPDEEPLPPPEYPRFP
jgi:hypothetical protein